MTEIMLLISVFWSSKHCFMETILQVRIYPQTGDLYPTNAFALLTKLRQKQRGRMFVWIRLAYGRNTADEEYVVITLFPWSFNFRQIVIFGRSCCYWTMRFVLRLTIMRICVTLTAMFSGYSNVGGTVYTCISINNNAGCFVLNFV